MPTWRCPHCSTPQAEAARCWVCHRSSSGCGSCRNFRRSIAAGVGYCALDRGRAALDGQEIRPCWVPVITLTSGPLPVIELDGLPGSGLLNLEATGADPDAGRFWHDAEL